MRNIERNERSYKRYDTIIIVSIFSGFSVGFLAAFWTATYKLSRLKLGDDPDMAQDQINAHYNSEMPSVILNSSFIGLAIMILASIVSLFIRFKYYHNIIVFREVMQYFKNSKQ